MAKKYYTYDGTPKEFIRDVHGFANHLNQSGPTVVNEPISTIITLETENQDYLKLIFTDQFGSEEVGYFRMFSQGSNKTNVQFNSTHKPALLFWEKLKDEPNHPAAESPVKNENQWFDFLREKFPSKKTKTIQKMVSTMVEYEKNPRLTNEELFNRVNLIIEFRQFLRILKDMKEMGIIDTN